MNNNTFIVGAMALTIFCFCGNPVAGLAAKPSSVVEQAPRSHDEDAIMQRLMRRPTPNQRIAAAANLRAAREAADPTLVARKISARKAAARTADARIAALRDISTTPKTTDPATLRAKIAAHKKIIRDAEINEAKTQKLAASATESVNVNSIGGTNE